MRVIARNLAHRFGGSAPLFSDLSFELTPNTVHALVGPSGAGKSTLLAILAGWTAPTGGQLIRDGIERVSWVFQNPNGVAARSALDHVALPILARGETTASAHEEAAALLGRFGLGQVAESAFQHLSGGEAQRLMLARGIASRPHLLLVDEPTAQLDREASHTVNQSLAALAGEGAIIVVATHDAHTRDVCGGMIDLGADR